MDCDESTDDNNSQQQQHLPMELISEIVSFWDTRSLLHFLSKVGNKSLVSHLLSTSDAFNVIELDMDIDYNHSKPGCLLSKIANLALFVANHCNSNSSDVDHLNENDAGVSVVATAENGVNGDNDDERLIKCTSTIVVRNVYEDQLRRLAQFCDVLCLVRPVTHLLFHFIVLTDATNMSYSVMRHVSNTKRWCHMIESIRYQSNERAQQHYSYYSYRCTEAIEERTEQPLLKNESMLRLNRLRHWDFSYAYGFYDGASSYTPVELGALDSIRLSGHNFQGLVNYDQYQYKKWSHQIRGLYLSSIEAHTVEGANLLKYVIPENLLHLSLREIEFTAQQLSQTIAACPNLKSLNVEKSSLATHDPSNNIFAFNARYFHPNLKSLTLKICSLKNDDFEAISLVFPNLDTLAILSNVPHVDASRLTSLATLNKLTRLDLSKCSILNMRTFCFSFAAHPHFLRSLVDLSLCCTSDDPSVVDNLEKILPLLCSVKKLTIRGPVNVVKRHVQQLLARSQSDMSVHFVSTHVDAHNLYDAETVDIEASEECSSMFSKCSCVRTACAKCHKLIPGCCTVDHHYVCTTRFTPHEYVINCPTCLQWLNRSEYYGHMEDHHRESVGCNNRQGVCDETYWRCPAVGCSRVITVPTSPAASLPLRLGRAKVHHLYHECDFNLVYDRMSDRVVPMHQLANNNDDDATTTTTAHCSIAHIKSVHQQAHPLFHELLSTSNPFQARATTMREHVDRVGFYLK